METRDRAAALAAAIRLVMLMGEPDEAIATILREEFDDIARQTRDEIPQQGMRADAPSSAYQTDE